jgi:hypothetical protein
MPEHLEEVWGVKALGTAVEKHALPATTMDAVAFAKALRYKLLQEVGQP